MTLKTTLAASVALLVIAGCARNDVEVPPVASVSDAAGPNEPISGDPNSRGEVPSIPAIGDGQLPGEKEVAPSVTAAGAGIDLTGANANAGALTNANDEMQAGMTTCLENGGTLTTWGVGDESIDACEFEDGRQMSVADIMVYGI